MNEQIVDIKEYSDRPEDHWTREAGFKIFTTEQVITLAIDDESSCCESWGYFLTEDDTDKFIGADLVNVVITDTNRSSKDFKKYDPSSLEPYVDNDDTIHLDEGEVLFVDLETNRGNLQFVAYNAHNGYYGHRARISSKQLTHEITL